MSKTPYKASKSSQIRNWISRIEGKEFNNWWQGYILSSMSTTGIFWRLSYHLIIIIHIQAPSAQFFQLDQHNQTAKHRANAERFTRTKNSKQQFLKESTSDAPDQFAFELCDALISANIPFSRSTIWNSKHFWRNIQTGMCQIKAHWGSIT